MMDWKQMSKTLIPLSFLCLSCVFADGELADTIVSANGNRLTADCPQPCPPPPCKPVCPKPCPPPPCKPVCPKPKQVPCVQIKKTECVPCAPCILEGITPFVLTTSRPCNDVGIYFFIDALYWHADIGNTDYAFVKTTPPLSSVTSGKNEQLNFKWNWGFKVGLGFDLDHDEWDTDFYYTWFVNKTQHNSFTAPLINGTQSLNTNYPLGTLIATGSGNAKLNFNVLDWELGRWFYISDSISIRPHAGLKGSWIRLKEKESFTPSQPFTPPVPLPLLIYNAQNKTKSWAVGPSVGVNSNWYFGSGNTIDPCDGHVRSRPHFSLFGDFSGALMYSHFSNSHSERSVGGTTAYGFKPSHLKRNLMVPVLTGFMGLAYDTCFNCDKYHFGIRLGYELQYWFRQNQRFAFDDVASVPRYTRATSEDLAVQGMTLDVRFDF